MHLWKFCMCKVIVGFDIDGWYGWPRVGFPSGVPTYKEKGKLSYHGIVNFFKNVYLTDICDENFSSSLLSLWHVLLWFLKITFALDHLQSWKILAPFLHKNCRIYVPAPSMIPIWSDSKQISYFSRIYEMSIYYYFSKLHQSWMKRVPRRNFKFFFISFSLTYT